MEEGQPYRTAAGGEPPHEVATFEVDLDAIPGVGRLGRSVPEGQIVLESITLRLLQYGIATSDEVYERRRLWYGLAVVRRFSFELILQSGARWRLMTDPEFSIGCLIFRQRMREEHDHLRFMLNKLLREPPYSKLRWQSWTDAVRGDS